MLLNASIVLYHTPFSEVEKIVAVLRQSSVVQDIFLLDNSETESAEYRQMPVIYIFNHKNLGYGTAHNIAIRRTISQQIPFHLVLNADVFFSPNILVELVNFMHKNAQIGSLMPKILYPDGKIQYLCKLLPTPFDLFGRRFLPKNSMQKRTERFEMRWTGYDHLMNVPYLSGCFMLLRTEALEKVGLFDERFFMYPEDVDLTRRIHGQYKTIFYPEVSVVHAHAKASYKNRKLLWIHIINMAKYFNKWGWFCDTERQKINQLVITDPGL